MTEEDWVRVGVGGWESDILGYWEIFISVYSNIDILLDWKINKIG